MSNTFNLLSSHNTIKEIITNKRLTFHFQPIISASKKSIIGFEGLARGVDHLTGKLIAPTELYLEAKSQNCLLELDRLCRNECLSAFNKHIYRRNDKLILFLNYEVSLIEEGHRGAMFMIDLAKALKINPYNIVIEIIESNVKEIKALRKFIEMLKYYGFLIALDDVGVGHSNFDRIPIVKPNIIKIDRSIIKGISKDYYKQEIFKALVNLCRKIGAFVLAEGVEAEEEVLWSLGLGADLLQGYYFSKPSDVSSLPDSLSLKPKISRVVNIYQTNAINCIRQSKVANLEYDSFMNALKERLSQVSKEAFEDTLRNAITMTTFVDALYILDKDGIQLTSTIVLYNHTSAKDVLHRPASKGDDLSAKDYYYILVHAGFNRYITDSYISHATGNRCRTISVFFTDITGSQYILCVDILEKSDYYRHIYTECLTETNDA